MKNHLRYYYYFYGTKSLLFYIPILVVYLTGILENFDKSYTRGLLAAKGCGNILVFKLYTYFCLSPRNI